MDEDFEKTSGYSLSDSLTRASRNQGSLLRHHIIYCTEDIHGGYDTYRAITEVNGGNCTLFRARGGAQVALQEGPKEETSSGKSNSSNVVYLLSGKTPADRKLWSKFRRMVKMNGKKPQIVCHDWLLQTALSQQDMSPEDYILGDTDSGA